MNSYLAIACVVLSIGAARTDQCRAQTPPAVAPSPSEAEPPNVLTHLHVAQSFRVEPDVEFLAWSADESKIATAGQLDRVLQVWNWRDRKVLARLMKSGLGGGSIWFVGDKIVTSPVSADLTDALTLWDYQSNNTNGIPMPGPPLRPVQEKFAVDGLGTRLALQRTWGRVIVFDVRDWRATADFDGLKATAIALRPDGNELATADLRGTISIYDVKEGTLRLQFKAWPEDAQSKSIAWAPNGRAIASGIAGSTTWLNDKTGTYDNSNHKALVRLFDPNSGKMISETKTDIGDFAIHFLTFSRDSTLLLSNQQNGVLRVWDASDLSLVKTISTEGQADFFSFSPSGRYLAVSRRDRVLIFEWP